MRSLMKGVMKGLMKGTAVAGILLAGNGAFAELSGHVALVSDYRIRGVSQSGEDPTIQAGLQYFHESGIYVGWWGSGLDYYSSSDPYDNEERAEHDFYIGYFHQLSDDLSYDLTYYEYVLAGAKTDVDYSEIALGLDYKLLRLVYWYASKPFDVDEDYHYIEADYKISLPADFTLTLHAGYSYGDALDAAVFGYESYIDYGLKLEKNIGGVDVSLMYADTNIDKEFAIDEDYNANQQGWVVALTKNF